jgi:hypothetical protein
VCSWNFFTVSCFWLSWVFGVLFGSSGCAVVFLQAVCFLLGLGLALAAAAAGNKVVGCGVLWYLAADG